MTRPRHILLLSAAVVTLWFLGLGNVGLDLADEGYLWHDVQRTAGGAVPIRDFRSYDPGRYYWGAAWALLLGEGLLPLRFSCALFQVLGVFAGLSALARAVTQRWLLAPLAVGLVLWTFPRPKLFEHAFALTAVLCAVRLVEKPGLRRHLESGILIGLAAFFGRNLGVYFALGFSALILFIGFGSGPGILLRRWGACAAGIALGYLPMIAMLLGVPGFRVAVTDSILRLTGPYAPVKPLPVPWPWRTLPGLSTLGSGAHDLLGWAFVLMLVYAGIALFVLVRSRRWAVQELPLLPASIFIGLPLLHHATVRFEASHFVQGTSPLLIGAAGWAAFLWGCRRRAAAGGVIALLLLWMATVVVSSPELSLFVRRVVPPASERERLVRYRVSGDELWIPRDQARWISRVKTALTGRVGPGDHVLIAPHWPGLYPILGTTSPTWDAFPIHSASPEEQARCVRDLEEKRVRWAVISDQPLDGVAERRFSVTHADLWRYLRTNFATVAMPRLPPGLELLCKRDPSAGGR